MLDDGSLYIADVGLQHIGNYSCHDERWPDVSQTHVVDVQGLSTHLYYTDTLCHLCSLQLLIKHRL